MISKEATLSNLSRQEQPEISAADRRLILGANLRLRANRFTHGRPILTDDVLRLASVADDAMERAA